MRSWSMLESKDVGSNSENARTRSCGASAGVFVRVYELMTNQILQTRREHCNTTLTKGLATLSATQRQQTRSSTPCRRKV